MPATARRNFLIELNPLLNSGFVPPPPVAAAVQALSKTESARGSTARTTVGAPSSLRPSLIEWFVLHEHGQAFVDSTGVLVYAGGVERAGRETETMAAGP